MKNYAAASYPHLEMANDFKLPYSTVLLIADALPKMAVGKKLASDLRPFEFQAMLSVEKLPNRDDLFAAIETVYRRYHP